MGIAKLHRSDRKHDFALHQHINNQPRLVETKVCERAAQSFPNSRASTVATHQPACPYWLLCATHQISRVHSGTVQILSDRLYFVVEKQLYTRMSGNCVA